MPHTLTTSNVNVSFANDGSFTRAASAAYVASKSYSGSTAFAHATNVASIGRDLPLLAAQMEHELGAGLALLANGLTTDSSPAYSAGGASSVAITRATRKTAITAMLTDLGAMVTALTAAKDAL